MRNEGCFPGDEEVGERSSSLTFT